MRMMRNIKQIAIEPEDRHQQITEVNGVFRSSTICPNSAILCCLKQNHLPQGISLYFIFLVFMMVPFSFAQIRQKTIGYSSTKVISHK